ncbi:hypothetical protein FQR65_LT03047 [Abscondita terminalis]|nr:hypothetical protein FQR65_LT03047 [Abscondita terminalis]
MSFHSEINKLKNIQQHLERHGNTFIDAFSKINQNSELSEIRSEKQKSRLVLQGKIKNDIESIVIPLKKMNDSLKKKNLSKLDIKTVRKDMIGIQSNIKNLKEKNQISLDELKKEERNLIHDLETFQDKIDKWEKRKYDATPQCMRRTVSTPGNISNEVKTFLEFVTTSGGHENGWNLDDHALFLRLRNKFKDNNKLAEAIHAMLPDISEKEVIAHEKWYTKYLELKEKQKNSIKHWRASKNNTQKTPPTNNSPEKVIPKVSRGDVLEKEMMQEKLQAWKTEKLRQSKFEYEQKQQELAKKKEEETAKRLKQQELREQVNNWKNSKKTAEEEEKQKKEDEERREQKERALRANKLIKEYQNQDELFVQHKLQKLQSKLPPVIPQKKSEIKCRNPSRLLQPTQQWLMKKYTDSMRINQPSNMNIQAIPKLKTPEWRKYIL